MNPVVHFELPAKDMNRAKTFYEKVFGWEVNQWGDDYFLVTTTPVNEKMMAQKPGEINGAIQKKTDSIGSPRVVVNVANIDEAINKVKAEGGKIFQPKTEVPNMMYYAIVYDTEGNELGVIENIPKK
jgi:predicted enzyme related to lactoylglutathione lyase